MALFSKSNLNAVGLNEQLSGTQIGAANDLAVLQPATKEEKKPGILARISPRERILVGVLIFLIVVGGIGYFAVFPAMQTASQLETEIAELKEKKTTIQETLARADGYRAEQLEAASDFATYSKFFMQPMQTENIDRLVSGMVVDAGMEPLQLDIGQLVSENVQLYYGSKLSPELVEFTESQSATAGSNGNDDTSGSGGAGSSTGASSGAASGASGGGGGNGNGSGNGSGGGDSATGSDSTAGFADSSSAGNNNSASVPNLIYVCTLNIRANSDYEELYAFLAKAKENPAIEVTSYTFTEGDNSKSDTGMTVNIQMKLYFFAVSSS
jgi:type II secretory pathway component PulM